MKTKFKRISIVGLFAACILITGAVFATFVGGLFNNPNNIAHVSYNNGNYIGSGAFVFGDDTITGNYSITLSGYNTTLTCHEQIVGYYENPFWGNDRIWPLDSNTLSALAEENSNFTNLSITGGFFTSCTDTNVNPYAIFGYIKYDYTSTNEEKHEIHQIWAGISGLNSDNPVFEDSLFLLGGGSGYDLSASGWIFDSTSYTGIVTSSASGNYSGHKDPYLGTDTPAFNFVNNSPSFKSGNVWYTTGQNINVKMHGITGYHWHLSGDLTDNKSGIFDSSDIETGITLTSGTGVKTVKFSVFIDENGTSQTVYSGNYQITLISENEGNGGTPNTESGSVSCTWSGPTSGTILTGGLTTFTLSCVGSGSMDGNFQGKIETIHYNGGVINIDYVNLSNITVTFTAGNSTGTDVRLKLKSGAVCLENDSTICNDTVISNTFIITGTYASGGDNPGPGTQSGQAPTINIVTQPSDGWAQSKVVKATSSNYSGFRYVITSSATCNTDTNFNNSVAYAGDDIILSNELDNNKYICFRAWNNNGTGYARSEKITKIDTTNPNCVWGQPSKTELYVGETGFITLTCVDTGAGIANSSLSNSNLAATYGVLSFSNATVSGDPSSKNFSFVYTALNTGETTISILGSRINDGAGNSNANAESQSITVIEQDNPGLGSSSCERLIQFVKSPYSTWSPNATVEIEWRCGSVGGWRLPTDNSASGDTIEPLDYISVDGNSLSLIVTGTNLNNKYVCAFAQTGERIETICSQYPFLIDPDKPVIELINPDNGSDFELGDTVNLVRSGHDLTSGISGYTLKITKPNNETIIKYFDSATTSTGIVVDNSGRWNWDVRAYDYAGQSTIKTQFFNVAYSGGNNSGGTNTGSNETGETITGFNLISPALFDRLSLGSDIIFKWDSGEINSGYRLNVEKVGGDAVYSGSTTGTTVTLNSGYFSTGAYSWSVEDIATNTIETIPLFYIVDAQYLPDLKINQFEFDEIKNADIDEYYKSNEATIDGLENGWYTFAYLQDGVGALYINGDFVGTQGFVSNGDIVRIELKSSHENSTTVSTKLIVGAGANLVSGDFKVTTRDGINGWDDPLLTPLQKLWGTIFVDSLVEMYQNNPEKLATFLSTFMQLLQDKSDYYAQEILNAQLSGDNELANEYRTYKNAVDFLYTIVKYRYDNLNVEDRTVYIAPNGKQYLVEYDEHRMAYTSPDFARPKYFPTWELFTNHIDMNNPAVGKWGIVGNVITTHNGKVYTIYETNGKWTSSNFKTAKYFDTKEDIINHILANNPASDWNHTVDPDFSQVVYTAPNGKVYKIFKTSSKGNNPNMYSSYNFVNAKYFTSLEAAKKFIDQNNKK